MGIFSKFFEKRYTINGYDNEEFFRLLGINTVGIDKNKLGEITYFTCLRLLAESLAKLPLKLYKETDNGYQKATNHYLYNLLKLRPNPYMSAFNFWTFCEVQRNHFGNTFVYIDTIKVGRNAGKVKALYVLPSQQVVIWIDNAGIIGKDNAIWYVYTDNNANEYKLNQNEVLHFKTSMTLDGIVGLSVQDVLSTTVENAQSGQKFINTYFKQGLFAKGLLQYTGDLNSENMKKMQIKFESMANGIANAGRILPVPLGFTFSPLNADLKTSQFLELNKYTALQIAGAFGIKPGQLNQYAESGKYNNVELQQREFYVDTLLSILTQYEQELNYKLLTTKEQEQGYYFKFNVDSILRGDTKTRIEALATAINNGIMTPNEARQKEDLPLHPEGDKLIVNGNYIPLEMVGEQYMKGGGNTE